jgi:hypothetical protein
MARTEQSVIYENTPTHLKYIYVQNLIFHFAKYLFKPGPLKVYFQALPLCISN